MDGAKRAAALCIHCQFKPYITPGAIALPNANGTDWSKMDGKRGERKRGWNNAQKWGKFVPRA